MSKRRRYFDNSQEDDSAVVEEAKDQNLEDDSKESTVLDNRLEAEEQILEDALDKIEKVKETYIPKEPRIPTMLKNPDRLEKGKRRVKSTRLRLRKEPSRVAPIVSLLEKDTIITVDISYKDLEWDKVIDDNGNTKGYVMKIYVTPYN